MLKFLFGLFILFPSFSFAGNVLISDCRIMNEKGRMVMTFPGKQCVFMDDGSVISSGKVELRRIGPDGELMWEEKLISSESKFFLSRDGQNILVTSAENSELPSDLRRYFFRIYDLKGKLLKENESFSLFGQNKKFYVTDFGETGRGKYFVNIFNDGLYILDNKLSKVEKKITFPGTNNHRVKDVQLTATGTFLYLHMQTTKVTLAEYFPGTNKSLKRYPPGNGASFYFPYGGSLTQSGNSYVINHPLSGTYVISRKTGKVEDFIVETHATDTFRAPYIVVKQNLDSFFSRWKF